MQIIIGILVLIVSTSTLAKTITCEEYLSGDLAKKRIVPAIKATEPEVADLYEQYPIFKKQIASMNNKIAALTEMKIIDSLADSFTPEAKPELEQIIIGLHNYMADKSRFADYIQTLIEDAAVFMMKNKDQLTRGEVNGTYTKEKGKRVKKLEYLKAGIIDNHSLMKVLISRARSRSQIIGVIPKKFNYNNNTDSQSHNSFFEVPARGPFIDAFFGKEGSHGQNTHFLQMDYVYEYIFEATNGEPEVFWRYIATGGNRIWDKYFDATSGSTIRQPEFLKPMLKPEIQIL